MFGNPTGDTTGAMRGLPPHHLSKPNRTERMEQAGDSDLAHVVAMSLILPASPAINVADRGFPIPGALIVLDAFDRVDCRYYSCRRRESTLSERKGGAGTNQHIAYGSGRNK